MSYFDYDFIPLPLSPAAETEPVVSTAAETEPVVSTAAETEPVVSTAAVTEPVVSTATPDQPSSQPTQEESTEGETNSSTGATKPTPPSAEESRTQTWENLEEKKQEWKKWPLRSQDKKTQEQGPRGIEHVPCPIKRQRRKRCGECAGCKREHDCGQCKACKHKPKFGADKTWNRVCTYRRCEHLTYDTLTSTTNVSTSGTRPDRLAADMAQLPGDRTKRERKEATGRPPSKFRCGTCAACIRNTNFEDCRRCVACKGKKKYGGSGRSHRICILRECENVKLQLKMLRIKRKSENIPEASGSSPVKRERLDHGTATVRNDGERGNTESEALQEQPMEFADSDPHPSQSTPGDVSGPAEDEIDNKPTLLEMLKFPGRKGQINIPQTIGTNYLTFGIFLLSDEDGTKVDAVAEKHGALGILKSWVQGEGQRPVSWRTLVQVLKDSGFTALAEEIEDVKTSFIYVHVV